VLNIENLSSGYGRSDVIRGIDIEVPKGHLVCIIGGNGAGKSTTMRTVSGMMNATSGRVCLGGRDITNMPSHRIASLGLAHVPEGRRVFVSMSAFDNLRLGAYRRTDRRAVIRDLDGVMETFPRLAERRGQLAGTLSGGEQQMLAIGRALMAAPEMLLLDEPSLGLAPKLVEEVYATIEGLRKQGRTMLIVEQFANIALNVADVGYVLENGRIVLSGSGKELLSNPRVQAAYVGGSNKLASSPFI
jgi:branched-chain amino acid transport system ATP-binding protein